MPRRPPRPRPFVLLAGLLAMTAVVTAAIVVGSLVGREPTRPAAVVSVKPVGTRALRVLHDWDERRALVWREGSVVRLTGLYPTGSPVGAADRAMMRAYRERGLRVIGMRRQTLAVRVLRASRDELTLRVTDRLQRAIAIGEGVRERLPQGRVSTRTLTFRRTHGAWVLVG